MQVNHTKLTFATVDVNNIIALRNTIHSIYEIYVAANFKVEQIICRSFGADKYTLLSISGHKSVNC